MNAENNFGSVGTTKSPAGAGLAAKQVYGQ